MKFDEITLNRIQTFFPSSYLNINPDEFVPSRPAFWHLKNLIAKMQAMQGLFLLLKMIFAYLFLTYYSSSMKKKCLSNRFF